MTGNFITLSLETHLFFSRIMKEHAFFLGAGFPCTNTEWMEKADYFRQQFEDLLTEVVEISDGRIRNQVLISEELVTEFTIDAENMTGHLSGVPFNTELSEKTHNLSSGSCREQDRELHAKVRQINERSLCLLEGLIEFKESILREVKSGRLFNFNYPLLIKHILREAKLYHFTIECLMHNRRVPLDGLLGTEEFWNQIMMEHALFIRGLLDPSEEELIKTAHNFAKDYRKLLKKAREQDCIAAQELTGMSLEETLKYRDFKAAGAKGILNCEIASILLPLLADHVLREANHYIRILQTDR